MRKTAFTLLDKYCTGKNKFNHKSLNINNIIRKQKSAPMNNANI